MDIWNWPTDVRSFCDSLAGSLHARVQGRLSRLLLGALLAQGRRTVTSWLRAVDIAADFRKYYYLLGCVGRVTSWCGLQVLWMLAAKLEPGERWLFAVDDSPTKRYGPCVEGAGYHHNPTPGPTEKSLLYGHAWVTMAWIVRHPRWGTLALPLLAKLYVRLVDVAKLMPWYEWQFQTKLQLAAEMLRWLNQWLNRQGKTVWVVVDGFYNKKEFLQEAGRQQITVVGRMAKNAALRSVPSSPKRRGRGAPRKYGKERLSLAKRAAHRQGWQTLRVWQYGKERVKTIKTFEATWRPAGGKIRVVIVREAKGWLAYACTDVEAPPESILEAAAARTAIEQTFCDVKEVHGAGQQQLRNLWANIGAWHVTLWLYSLVEWWAWDRSDDQLQDRSVSPWDNTERRPSHAEKRKALQNQCLADEFSRGDTWRSLPPKIRRLLKRLLKRSG